jgi:hypothetical protein
MNKIRTTALASVLAVAGTLGALAAPKATPPVAGKTETVVGEIRTVNAESKTFSLETKDRTESFTLGANASVTAHDYKSIHLADLAAGERVEVRFSLAGATRTASSVHVLGRAAKSS